MPEEPSSQLSFIPEEAVKPEGSEVPPEDEPEEAFAVSEDASPAGTTGLIWEASEDVPPHAEPPEDAEDPGSVA